MRELVAQYLSKTLSRRSFIRGLARQGISATAAGSIVGALTPLVSAIEENRVSPDGVTLFEGTAGAALAEQLIASGVRYIFGNSASRDAPFYDALVDRPELTYILTPHEGPGAAMAAGYVKAAREPAIAMQAGVVGLLNAMGQMYNAHKEQTPLVFCSYRRQPSNAAGRNGFEEVLYQEELVGPLTKYRWLATRPEMVPETARRAFKVAWTPPYGPTYATWPSDFLGQQVRTEVIVHDKVDPRMRVRPDPREVERAARLLLDARSPLLIVGDELYKARAIEAAVGLAERLGLPVTQARQVHVNFPQNHPLWVGGFQSFSRMDYPQECDLAINVGNTLQQRGASPLVPRRIKFVDLRIDSGQMGDILRTDVPLVADVAYGLEDLQAALDDLMTPAIEARVKERSGQVKLFSQRARRLRRLVSKNPEWDDSPMLSDRITYEVAQFADQDAIIVDEAGSIGRAHSFEFDPLNGRELFYYYGAHLGSGVGTAAGVKLARPDRQVICLVGDGSFIFGPTALWNMARLELPVIVVVYNNHAYGGPHNRSISHVPESRMVETGRFVHDYLGKPDMNMAEIARGFGVQGEVARTPGEFGAALQRARLAEREGKPYLIDAQVARFGAGWKSEPWTPSIR